MSELMIKNLLKTIADITGEVDGAFNLRSNGCGVERRSSENIIITPKEDKPGIDITVKPNTKNETVYIPVVITEDNVNDLVYNDFYIGENSDVTIVAGCGIHNDGCGTSEHDGIHTFYIGKNAKVKYGEKHYGEGSSESTRILNPTTIVHMEEDSYYEMDMTQIKGVNSTKRETEAFLGKGAKLIINEKLMTHDEQIAHSNVKCNLNGEDSILQIISRSVAKDKSVQVFHPIAIGNDNCKAHVQCDSIIMDKAKVSSIPEIQANHTDAQIVHEAAIGRINNEQLLKLETFGLSEEEAEEVIVNAFLS
ncbi:MULTISPECIES: SufB/SufD family protein [Terrisporobacter]|uniref:SufD family Fe-S cluster assembly protein n=1 Tax=Terrisporobacter muris TaxID=2963284 RepID=A0A9X2ME72_9FIRM|nr:MULTISPECIES: SufD family Fe-S cluster assembly protein [Terrisporobacter]MCR1822321.1 SufD family Fe-S cluster assembly protein [Terrisporobacter muris]MDY3372675.1 SufD family Fe-S cluster assembly protein [Terrisporobacter othiniensis]